jgi:hypothetical protein
MKDVLNQVLPVFMQAIVSILGILISIIATKAMSYLTAKKAEVVGKIGADQYNLSVSVAESIFYGIEQQMKTASGTAKKDEFNKRIMAKIPGITSDDIDHLREAIVGKAKGLTKIITEQVPVQTVQPWPIPTSPGTPWNNPIIYGNSVTHPIASTNSTSTTTTTTANEGVVSIDANSGVVTYADEIPPENANKDV